MLERVRRRSTTALVLALCARVLRSSLVVLAVLIALDWLFRLPEAFRTVEVTACAVAVVVWVVLGVRKIKAFQPTLVDLALRVERARPALRNQLAALIDFEQSAHAADPSHELLQRELQALRHTVKIGLRGVEARDVTSLRLAQRPLQQMVLVVCCWIAAIIMIPTVLATGVERALTPWTGDEWPSSTAIEDRTEVSVVARGTSFPIMAELVRGDPATERVRVDVRIKTGDWSGWQSGWMARDNDARFERSQDVPATAVELEYRFITSDATSDPHRVRCVSAPAIVNMTIEVQPPDYLGLPKGAIVHAVVAGRTQVRTTEALEGSIMTLRVEFAGAVNAPEQTPAGCAEAIGLGEPLDGLAIEPTTNAWTVVLPLRKDTIVTPNPVDTDGLRAIDPPAIRLVALTDQPPIATLTEPTSDQTVLPTATLPAVAQAQDDYGLVRSGIVAQRTAADGSDAEQWLVDDDTHATTAQLEAIIDITALGGEPGDVIIITARSQDAWVRDGTPRPSSVSAPRRLRVVSTSEFNDEIASATAALRQGVLRLEERQEAARQAANRTNASRTQADVTTRSGQAVRQAKALADRVRANEGEDTSVSRLLDEASQLLEDAQTESSSAAESMAQAPRDAWQTPAVAEHQALAQQALEDAAALLDRDTNSWEASQSLARAAEAIQKSQQERAALAEHVQGRDRAELAPSQRAALDRVAEQDATTAQALREATAAMERQASELQASDPVQAATMKQAAERAQKEGVVSKVEEAGRETQANALQPAQQAGAQALESLQRMQEDLNAAQEMEARVLKRLADDLVVRLARLVAASEGVEAVAHEEAEPNELPRDELMRSVDLLRRNSIDTLDEARSMDRQLAAVVHELERATKAESSALEHARDLPEPTAVDGLRVATTVVTQAHKAALKAAQAAADQAEQEQEQEARKKLAAKCDELRAAELHIVDEAVGLAAKEDPRRVLVEGRRLALSQERVSEGLSALMEDAAVAQSEVFGEALSLASTASLGATTAFRAGTQLPSATEQAREVLDVLSGLANALSDLAKRKDQFAEGRDQQQQSGGGGGGGSGDDRLLPIVELKLLRDLQARVMRQSAAALREGGDRSAVPALTQSQQRLEGMGERLRQVFEQARQPQSGPQIRPNEEPTPPPDDDDGAQFPTSRLWRASGSVSMWSMRAHALAAVISVSPVLGAPWESARHDEGASSAASPHAAPSTDPSTDEVSPRQATPPRAKTIDELLEIPSDGDGAAEAERVAREQLDRALGEQELADTFERAVGSMRRSAELLADAAALADVTRAQQDALNRLDAIIDEAQRRQQQQQQSSSSSSKSSSSQGQSKPKGSRGGQQEHGERQRRENARNNKQQRSSSSTRAQGEGEREAEADGFEDQGEAGSFMAGEAEWGALPPRVREQMRQGMRERMSSIYRTWTERYYERVAKESRP